MLAVTALAAALLGIAHPAASASTEPSGGPIAQVAPSITVLRTDAFETDSVLEVDRSLNAATGGSGTVGSDREGGPGD